MTLIKDSMYRNSIWLILDSAVLTAFGFIFWTINTRLFTSEQIGIAGTLITITELLGLAAVLGFNIGLIKYIRGHPGRLVNSCLAISVPVAIVAGIIFVFVAEFFSPNLKILKVPLFAVIFVLFVVFEVFYKMTASIFIAKQDCRHLFVRDFIFSFTKIVIAMSLAILGVFGIISAWLLALIISSLIGLWFMEYRPRIEMHFTSVKKIFRFSIANHIANFLSLAPGLVMPLIITSLLDPQTSAYFYIGWMIATLLNVIPHSVSKMLLAQGSGNLAKNVKKSLLFTYASLLPAALFIFFAGKYLLLMFGAEYSAGTTQFLQILAIASIPLAINIIFVTLRNVQDRTNTVIGINVVITAIFLVVSISVLSYGLVAVAWVWLITHSIVAVYSTIGTIRVLLHE